jgi:hypothetical protein
LMPSLTLSCTGNELGPSSMPSACSCAQLNVGLLPPAAPAWPLTVYE